MIIERRIRLNDRHYFLGIELKYNKDKVLDKADGTPFDMGDLSIMIDMFEKDFEKNSKNITYDTYIPYMNEVIYLYDRFPFISYIKDVSYGRDGNITYLSCMNKDEIIKYIKDNNIKINKWDKKESPCPLLYEETKKNEL